MHFKSGFTTTVLWLLFSLISKAQQLTSFVDPMTGSGGHGHVFIGASVPFGAVQAGPNNFFKGWDWCSGYHYSDSIIIGFAQTHLSGTGIGDLGDVLIMPYTGAVKTGKGSPENVSSGYGSHFSHANETVKPGYYKVKLDNNVTVELTASERVAYHRYQFPANSNAHIIIDLKEGISDEATNTYIEQVDATTFKGYRFSKGWANDQRLFFAIKISKPVNDFKIYDDSVSLNSKIGKGKAIKGLISFKNYSGIIDLKVGISPVSADNALENVSAEIPGWNFDAMAKLADEKWNKELSKFRIETTNENDKKIFYTALYHTLINPSLYNDHNGDYLGADKKVYKAASFNNYTVFSLWDSYRGLQPLYTIFQSDKVGDMIQSMLVIYQQQGKLPVWHLQGCETNTMPGISSAQVVAEAYLKGIKGFDEKLAFEAVKNSMMRNERGLKYDKDFRFIPSDSVQESVAKALEYCVSNASIALMEKKAGNVADYDYFNKRINNYKLYFDSSTKFFRGKKADGKWNEVFDPIRSSHPYINDLAEGNHWQYLWLVPGDVEGLIQLLGGNEGFIKKLDSLFILQSPPDPNAPPDISGMIGEYAHGNEPCHHIMYLYAYAGEQWKCAEKTRYALQDMYTIKPDGIIGNDDCGQMSAWYVLSSVGLYPVFPANGAFVFGSPLFNKVSISLPGNKTFVMEAANNSAENMYIQKAELNGKPYEKTYIMYNDIIKGGVLKFIMGNMPNKQYGADENNRPKSVYP